MDFSGIILVLLVLNPFSERIGFSHLNVEKGLSHNTVLSLAQDPEGFIWAGTRYGLNRFDGNDVKIFTFNPADSTSLSNDYINKVLVDTGGRLWIGTENGLNLYDRAHVTFQAYFPPGFKKKDHQFGVRTILDDGRGKFWIGTFDGLFCFDARQKAFVKISADDTSPYRIGHDNIRCLALDDNGELLVGTTRGLKTLERGGLINFAWPPEYMKAFRDLFVRAIYTDPAGPIWFGSEEEDIGLIKYDPVQGKIEMFNQSPGVADGLVDNLIRCIKRLDEDHLYIGTRHGLSILNIKERKFRNYVQNKYDPGSLSSESIRDILRDRDGGLWIATYSGGINYYHKTRYTFGLITQKLGSANTLSDRSISAVFMPDSTQLWIGTENSGLNIYDIKRDRFAFLRQGNSRNGIVDNNIKAMARGPRGDVWVGTYNGLSRINPRSLTCENYLHEAANANSLSHNQIHALVFDDAKRLWLGTNGGGIDILDVDKMNFRNIRHDPANAESLVSDNINAMVFDGRQRLWIATQNGLDCYDPVAGTFGDVSGFPSFRKALLKTSVVSVFHDSRGRILAGTYGNGLFILSPGAERMINVSKENGMASNIVYAILEDKAGAIWLSTNQGLSKLTIDPDVRDSTSWNILNFDENEGLQGRQFLPNSCYYSPAGVMYFGGIRGLNYFSPGDIGQFTRHPNVVIKDLTIANKKREINRGSVVVDERTSAEPLVLDYKQSDFTVNFAGINYINPDRTVYAYLLDGGMDGWQYIGRQRSVTFSKLPAGSYTLRVKATNNPNDWGDRYTTLRLTVQPPPWRTPWAYCLYLILASGMLYLFFVVTIRWERVNHKLKYEHLEREKEQVLHEHQLRFFTDISHELRTPLTLIISPLENLIRQNGLDVKVRSKLMMIQRNGERMLQLINQLLDWQKLERGHMTLSAAAGNIVTFVQEVTLSFREMALMRNIRFSFHSEDERIEAFYDRDKLEVVFYNILSNAFKFTPDKGSIDIEIAKFENPKEDDRPSSLRNGYLRIRISDTGKGIREKNLNRIFDRFYEDNSGRTDRGAGTGLGLELAKKFIDLHKGDIRVQSRELTAERSGYTQFEILLPLGSDHLKEDEIIHDFKNSEDVSLYEQPKIDPGIAESWRSIASDVQNSVCANGKFLLLIVEDNTEVRHFIRNLFEDSFEVVEAMDGREGLDKALDLLPDLVISDIMMPEMDGLEMCRNLKGNIHTSHVPVILLTARTAITFKFEGFEMGADDYVTKPFSAGLLKARVYNLLRQRQRLRDHYQAGFSLEPERIAVTSIDERLLKKVMQYVTEHIADPDLSVESVSAEIGMSRVHFYRKIKSLTNSTPVELIRTIRLNRAAQLLREKAYSISEIRYMVGIQDAEYFRKCFKSQFGVTPSGFIEDPVPSNKTS